MSPPLAKAILLRLEEVKGTGKDPTPQLRPQDNGAFEVQFNPTSLRISRQNNIDQGAATTKAPRRQNPSAQSATLTFDLEFDTAELSDGQSSSPIDVRTKTLIVRQFAEPTKKAPKKPPPPIRFIWGTFVFTGLVTQVTEDLDYFSPDGRPLRAKVSVTITEKNTDWEAKLVGSATRNPATTTPGGGQGSGPGSPPADSPDSTAQAQDGESVQQLLSRLNADPATWRAAMAGLDSPIGLAAGAQVQLAAGVSASAGIGASAGFALGGAASASLALGAALGVPVSGGLTTSAGASAGGSAGFSGSAAAGFSASASSGAAADVSVAAGFTASGGVAADGAAAAGFSLAEGGGVAASFAVVASANADASVATARASFAVPSGPAGGMAVGASAIGSAVVVGLVAAAPVALDPRTQGYGIGIPLRARAYPKTVVANAVQGDSAVSARARVDEVGVTTNPALPAWVQLSVSSAGAGGGRTATPG